MRRSKTILFHLLILWSVSLFINPVIGQTLGKQQFEEDIDFLKLELPKRHHNLFAKISKEDFEAKLEAVKSISEPLNKETFIFELLKVFKAIGDEHTRLEPTYSLTYPIHFDFFKEGVFVTKAAPEQQALLDQKLEGVGTESLSKIIDQFAKVVKQDNRSYFEVFIKSHLANPNFLRGMGLSQTNQEISYQINGKSVELKAIPKKEDPAVATATPLRLKKSDNYWFEWIGKTLYFNYQQCAEDEKLPFEAFNEEIFKEIDQKKPEKIIIDLRNNGGGNSGILNPFLDRLKESKLNKKGKLYVLIGRETFSSALMNAVSLKRYYNSIIVGEPTSGTVNHYGEVRGFQLPNSKITVGYSTRYWETWKGYDGPLRPDVQIEYSIHQYQKGQDEAIDYVQQKR